MAERVVRGFNSVAQAQRYFAKVKTHRNVFGGDRLRMPARRALRLGAQGSCSELATLVIDRKQKYQPQQEKA